MILLISILLVLLASVAYQDCRFRHIHIVLPLAIAIVSTALCIRIWQDWHGMIYNIVFFVITFAGLVIYLSVRKKKLVNPFENDFGLGDFLFFISVCPLFVAFNFILYFIFSLCFSLVIFLMLRKYMALQTIPLAGYAALFLILVVVKDLLFNSVNLTIL